MWTYTQIAGILCLVIENGLCLWMYLAVCLYSSHYTFTVDDGHMEDRVNVQANIHTNYAER